MKRLDMSRVSVVHAGEDWQHAHPPCNREMMCHLERNEKLVSWLQPVDGTVQDQIPAIKVDGAFHSISLRMMKAIWRHVRLRRGFDNVERAPYGGFKLRIPVPLLAEKHRTQSRFNVSRVDPRAPEPGLFMPPQVMRTMSGTPCPVKERKVSQSASSKIDSIVRQLFLPMLTMPTPSHTSFLHEGADAQILRQVAEEHPEVVKTEADFVSHMVALYRRFALDLEEPPPVPSPVDQPPPEPEEGGIGLPDPPPEAGRPLPGLDAAQRV